MRKGRDGALGRVKAMFRKILVPLDSSDTAFDVLPVVQKLVEGTTAEVTLFTAEPPPKATATGRRRAVRRPVPVPSMLGSSIRDVIPPEPLAYAESRDQAVERREHELLEQLADIAHPLIEAGGRVQTAVHFGDPVAEITEFAKRGGFDLIAMASHGRSGLGKALHGSVTAGVIRSGVTPVLVVRPHARTRKPAD
jgi:nucleotide-binding universal stress UspA family protein